MSDCSATALGVAAHRAPWAIEFLGFLRAAGVNGHRIACRHQVAAHRITHDAGADPAESGFARLRFPCHLDPPRFRLAPFRFHLFPVSPKRDRKRRFPMERNDEEFGTGIRPSWEGDKDIIAMAPLGRWGPSNFLGASLGAVGSRCRGSPTHRNRLYGDGHQSAGYANRDPQS